MEQTAYHVRMPAFEGPFELLLSLIEKRKVFAGDVSLADVADEYIAHIRGLSSFPVADAAGFLLVASTLALMKSRSLFRGFRLPMKKKPMSPIWRTASRHTKKSLNVPLVSRKCLANISFLPRRGKQNEK